MIAMWMVYCVLCALALSLFALLAERLLTAGRAPLRLVWSAAVALSLIIPAVALRFAPHVVTRRDAPAAVIGQDLAGGVVAPLASDLPPAVAAPLPAPAGRANDREATTAESRDTMRRVDQALAIAWITLSLALVVNFLGGIVTLAVMRRSWTQETVLGVPVYVSDHTGPAVVGAWSPSIVLPRWVLSLDPAQLALMIRHEQEHRRAGDGRLIALARLALVVMPWNAALWWQVMRLRVAVEMDCDARVLRDGDARTYGDLLLEVAGARRGPRLMQATAFAERATQLERRIRMLPRHRVRTTKQARALVAGLAIASVTIAWAAPSPPLPDRVPVLLQALAPASPFVRETKAHIVDTTPRVTDAPSARNLSLSETPATSVARIRASKGVAVAATTVAPANMSEGSTSNLNTRVAVDSLRTVPVLPDTDTTRWSRRPLAPSPRQVDSAFKRMFEGILLSPEQEAEARRLVRLREQALAARTISGTVTMVGNFTKAIEVQSRRDSALRALLTTDADRATFDARRSARGAGGRGRAGGGGGDSLVGALPGMAGRGGRGGGGRGGAGRGSSDDSSVTRMVGARGTVRGDTVTGNMRFNGYPNWRFADSAGDGRLRSLLIDSAQVTAQSDAVYHRLFDGIALTAVQDSSARAIVAKAQRESMELTRYIAPTDLRFSRPRDNAALAASDTALLAIVGNAADRAKLQARLRTPP